MLAGESPVTEAEQLNAEDRAREQLILGLRRLEGVNIERFTIETGFSPDTLAGDVIPQHVDLGFLERIDGHLRLTRAGLLVSDSLWPDFL